MFTLTKRKSDDVVKAKPNKLTLGDAIKKVCYAQEKTIKALSKV